MLQDLVVPEPDRSDEDWLERAVADACRLVGTSDTTTIRSITVVGGRRLTGAELLRMRIYAASSGVRLVMDGDGAVTLRREDGTHPPLGAVCAVEVVTRADAAQPKHGDGLSRRWWQWGSHFHLHRHGQ